MRVVIGTRGSILALWQTQYVAERLKAATPDLDIHVKTIQTQGDLVRDRPLSRVGGKGLFVKEIENALLSGEIDLAVHSLKDMPTEQPKGLTLGAILERADPRDALVVYGGQGDLDSLAPRARVGTSSLRRRAQLLAARPDLQVLDLRGNVDTRLRKLREGQYDAVVVAVAGLERLGHADTISQVLPLDLMLPAVGQGALCVEMRTAPRDDAAALGDAMQNLISALDHPPTRWATVAERAFLRRLEGGCQVPIGAFAQVDDGQLCLRGLIAALDGSRLVRDEIRGPAEPAEFLGMELAIQLLAAGGDEILEEVRRAS
jgi:hydroxymethylbilane synthase